MHKPSEPPKIQSVMRKLELFRQKQEENSVNHPLRSSLPFLCVTGVLMTAVVIAASCTLCYQVQAKGQSLAFFQDTETYDAAVSQAETRASKILETTYTLNDDLSVQVTLAPKDQIEAPARGHRLSYGEHPGAGPPIYPVCGWRPNRRRCRR